MATYPATSNMGLLLPQPSNATSPEPGPLWATDLNAAFTAIDSHDHSTGKGPKVTPQGLSINADLPFLVSGAYHGPTLMGYLGFYNNPSAAQADQPNSGMFVKAGDLYYRNSAAADVQITSGGNLNVNVVNAYAGFYGAYANGTSSANAVAYFNNTTKTYEFNLSTPTTPLGYTNVARIYGLGFAAISGGVAGKGFMAPSSVKMTPYPSIPKGNWAMKNEGSNGVTWTLAWDNKDNLGVCAGDYINYALTVAPSVADPVAMQFRMGLNVPAAAGSPGVRAAPQYPFDLNWWDSTTAGPQNMMALTSYANGAPAAGFGPRINFLAATTTWTASNGSVFNVNAVASSAQGAIDAFWQTVGTKAAGLRFRGAYNGSYSATPGLEIANLDGTGDVLGIGGAAVAGNSVTLYGNVVPNTDNSRNLGAAATRFANVYSRVLSSGAAALGIVGSTIGLTGNTTITGALDVTSTVSGTSFTPTATASAGGAGTGGLFKSNQVLAYGHVSAAAVVTNSFGVGSAGVAANTFTISLTRSVTKGIVIVTADSTDNANAGVANATVSGSTVTVVTFHGATTANAYDFQFVVIGEP